MHFAQHKYTTKTVIDCIIMGNATLSCGARASDCLHYSARQLMPSVSAPIGRDFDVNGDAASGQETCPIDDDQ